MNPENEKRNIFKTRSLSIKPLEGVFFLSRSLIEELSQRYCHKKFLLLDTKEIHYEIIVHLNIFCKH